MNASTDAYRSSGLFSRHREIISSNQLVADILPPPLDVLEANVLILQLAQESSASRQAKLIQRLAATRGEFEESAREVCWRAMGSIAGISRIAPRWPGASSCACCWSYPSPPVLSFLC